MALTLRHWIAAALLGCTAVAVAFLPPEIERPPERMSGARPEPGTTQQIGTAIRRDLNDVLFLERRDEALALLRTTRPGPNGTSLLVDPHLSARRLQGGVVAAVRALAVTLDSATAMLAPLDTSVRLAVMVTRDTDYAAPRVGGWVGLRGPLDLFPAATDGRTCLVVIPLGGRMNRVQFGSVSILGPCAFYAAFGQPGPGIAQWLDATRHYVAGHADWRRERPRDIYDFADVLRYMSFGQAWIGIGHAGLTLDGAACAAGELPRCHTLLERRPQFMPADPQRAHGPLAHIETRFWWMDDEQNWYLSDLVRLMGRERFARFWRSPLPRDSAFVAAFGIPMDQWTHRWLAERRPGVRVGSAVRLSSSLLGVLLAIVCVAGGAYYTTRRQIG